MPYHHICRNFAFIAVITLFLFMGCSDHVESEGDAGDLNNQTDQDASEEADTQDLTCSMECEAGLTCCLFVGTPTCVDTETSHNACGGCGVSCPGFDVCVEGNCQCREGYALCGGDPELGCNTQLGTRMACSQCGDVCSDSERCENSQCVPF